jgi:hypothetical protein
VEKEIMASKKCTGVVEEASANPFADTKLTRTEVVDLIMSEMQEEFQAQQVELQKQTQELGWYDSAEELKHLLSGDAKLHVNVQDYLMNQPNGVVEPANHEVVVAISVSVPISKMPASYIEWRAKHRGLMTAQRDLHMKTQELHYNKSKVKNEIIKRSLEVSVDGKQILENIENIKKGLKQKLLKS